MQSLASSDYAVVVVSAEDGPVPHLREQLLLARQAGIVDVCAVITKTDLVDDEELIELIELEVRELASSYDFGGDDMVIAHGSLLKLIGSEKPSESAFSTQSSKVFDRSALAERDNRSFLMPVSSVGSTGHKTAFVAGRVERGETAVGETLELVGFGPTRLVTVARILVSDDESETARRGDDVKIFPTGIGLANLEVARFSPRRG